MNAVEMTVIFGMISLALICWIITKAIEVYVIVFIIDMRAKIREAEKGKATGKSCNDLKLEVHTQE
ncbi:MAG: hypothetical protein J6O61_08025 [Butyrivibrio sp.]|uniref:hypothetical protein n=1 Tax=Butyrivibrio sp. TaxID=28121 RepID=UPI001B20CA88|nr:hypothetical protein [Butyrivibrio sp.]MBO6240762.1 hypothetical protein [Butyrivibrio sp.]